jgi:asparagine synthase (glutamine-hydrolysing)
MSHLDDATRLRLRSDVPVGVFLSGGLDSSLITALVDRHTDEPVRTYSVGFTEETYNELGHARTVADEFNTDHHEFTVEPEAIEILPELVRAYEQPFGDPSAIPTYYISEIASSDLRVVLNGDGGDENFAGYNHLFYDNLVGQFTRLPDWAQRISSQLSNQLPSVGPLSTAKRYVELGSSLPAERFATWMGNYDAENVANLLSSDSPFPTNRDGLWFFREAFEQSDGRTVLDDSLYVDLTTYLPEDLLVKVDRASMAHSLEVRSPFLDPELIAFTSQIPSKYKLRYGRKKKWLLKRASRGVVPDTIINREKQGFSVPIAEWLRGDMYGFAAERLLNGTVPENWFDDAYIRRLLDEHNRGVDDHAKKIWDLLLLVLWCKEFSDHLS